MVFGYFYGVTIQTKKDIGTKFTYKNKRTKIIQGGLIMDSLKNWSLVLLINLIVTILLLSFFKWLGVDTFWGGYMGGYVAGIIQITISLAVWQRLQGETI